MQFLIYIGKNDETIEHFSKTEQINFYDVPTALKATQLIDKIGDIYSIIILLEQHSLGKDINDIKELRRKYPKVYLVLVTEGLKREESLEYLKAGINNTISPDTSLKEVDEMVDFVRRRKQQQVKSHEKTEIIKRFKLPLWKRSFDVVFSLLALIILSPVFLIIMFILAVNGRGPVITTSKRVGSNYRIFDFLRFRTGVKDGDVQYQPTRFGRFLRKYSLDDLPQLINILKGDMSVVGNRPLPMLEAEQLTSDDYIDRFLAPAGLTGLWQMAKKGNAAGNLSETQRELDIRYAKTFSFTLDLKIIFKTFSAIVQKNI